MGVLTKEVLPCRFPNICCVTSPISQICLNTNILIATGGRARKRRRGAVDAIDIEDRLESLITRIGEKVCSEIFINNLHGC